MRQIALRQNNTMFAGKLFKKLSQIGKGNLPAGNWKWGGSSIRGEYSDVKTDG
jgi:hypothetical protein